MAFAATTKNDFLTGRKPLVTCDCNETVTVRYALTLPIADLELNDIGAIGFLPAGHVPVDIKFDSSDLDLSTGVVFAIGLSNTGPANSSSTPSVNGTALSTTDADGGTGGTAPWVTGITAGQTGIAAHPVPGRGFYRMPASRYDRAILLSVTTAPSGTAASGEVGVTLSYRAAPIGANI